jgi:hypothetical protein
MKGFMRLTPGDGVDEGQDRRKSPADGVEAEHDPGGSNVKLFFL